MEFFEHVLAMLRSCEQWYQDLIAELPGSRFVRNTTTKVLLVGLPFFFVIMFAERFYRTRTNVYRTRFFLQDLVYWFYYGSGVATSIAVAIVLLLIGRSNLEAFRLDLLTGLPFVWQALLWILIADFIDYWTHRLQHASPILWSFHATHHSQEHISFATGLRFHPVDRFVTHAIRFLPLFALGANPLAYLPLLLVIEFVATIEHTQIPWRLGPLYRVVVSPRFHSFHHSTDPRHFDKNFGGILSVWDFLFGTAVTDEKAPTSFGLTDVKMPTFASTLYMPFVLLYRRYARPRRAAGDPRAYAGSTRRAQD